MKQELVDLVRAMPKAELHLHIEGTLEPALMFALAARNGIPLPYTNVEELRSAYDFENLQDFLDLYYRGMGVLFKEADFYDLTMAYLERVHAQNVRHVEIFFDPQAHLERGVAFSAQIVGIHRALEDAYKKFGISFRLILSFLRHLSEESAFQVLEEALPFRGWIDGVGLDSSEVGNPPGRFRKVYAKCRELGFRLTAHAGEEGPPDYVKGALVDLAVERIDHGNRSLEDASLVEDLRRRRLTLTVCPLSNLKLKVVPDLAQHPLSKMLAMGLAVTVNSDDPAYFGGYIEENFLAMIEHGLTKFQLYQLARNAFVGSWLGEKEKLPYLREIDRMFEAD